MNSSGIKKISGGINAVKGIKTVGISCGIKTNGKKDLALILSETIATAAGTFTTNRLKAACVTENQKRIKRGLGQVIIANSGNANTSTGKRGLEDTKEVAAFTAENLNIPEELVLTASTGIIGKPLDVGKIKNGIKKLISKINSGDFSGASDAILTTDTFAKESAVEIKIGEGKIRIGGIAKGAGMVAPNMATMLAFIATDAKIRKDLLKKALHEAVTDSFNMITIDGCMSTNDMVLILANGMADCGEFKAKSREFPLFQEGLKLVAKELAKMIVVDGEGATKLIRVKVSKARSKKAAKTCAMAIANSNLVKTAFFGEIMNWGRIVAALGASGIEFSPEKVCIFYDGEKIVENGCAANFNKNKIQKILKKKEIILEVCLNQGKNNATVLTSDLSYEYVKINALYS
ncbi:MAG: bifunctional ornithine acetyltransferase/N-acetylglutamate synthase [Candidatus Schekmanbacteria bacterium RBG_16_38_11]|uniref:Arginine biosynthesis bifunctional protein ArgJ n=1 Tax=Candidatus Schekmanbacteria bacterium RBG_16_38_11 TaxID=1817880 RepID=A0A1F7RTH5_9BACT|nr:MAG: bifunctional ornithine acetyltransferase/N-acetylglutamate synthase [Candidatus Schekmanbacteria bacterium RBG_16_38_11]